MPLQKNFLFQPGQVFPNQPFLGYRMMGVLHGDGLLCETLVVCYFY
jgi:hypothetical protein